MTPLGGCVSSCADRDEAEIVSRRDIFYPGSAIIVSWTYDGRIQATHPRGYSPRTSRASSAPKRILYVEANDDGTVGGSYQALYDLIRRLDRHRYHPVALFYQDNAVAQRLRRAGEEVYVFEHQRLREKAIHASERRAAKLVEIFAAVLRRFRFIREQNIDLVHLNNSPHIANDDWLPAARLNRIPCIATSMGGARLVRPGPVHRWLARRIDYVVAISKYVADAMLRTGIPADRLDTVYLGVDIEGFRSRVSRDPRDVRREIGVAPDKVLVVMVGNVRWWKGQHVVLSAAQLMSAEHRRLLHIVFVGACGTQDAAYKRELDKAIETSGLADSVSFLGARSDVPDLLNAADIALHASVIPEPFGLVVLEAMALGKAVVAANKGGPAEYLPPGIGVTYDVEKPWELSEILRDLATDAGKRRALGERAYEHVTHYSIERNVEGVHRVYERIFAGR